MSANLPVTDFFFSAILLLPTMVCLVWFFFAIWEKPFRSKTTPSRALMEMALVAAFVFYARSATVMGFSTYRHFATVDILDFLLSPMLPAMALFYYRSIIDSKKNNTWTYCFFLPGILLCLFVIFCYGKAGFGNASHMAETYYAYGSRVGLAQGMFEQFRQFANAPGLTSEEIEFIRGRHLAVVLFNISVFFEMMGLTIYVIVNTMKYKVKIGEVYSTSDSDIHQIELISIWLSAILLIVFSLLIIGVDFFHDHFPVTFFFYLFWAQACVAVLRAAGKKISSIEDIEKAWAEIDAAAKAQQIAIQQAEIAAAAAESDDSLNRIIVNWESREDKPYLKEGITIAEVAEDMDVHPRLLSSYLNNVYKMNFNSWINNLRLKEVVRLLKEAKDMPISAIAMDTGFSDSTSLGRIFKKTYGMSPSEYRVRG